jgi:hypothetical protein
MAMPELLRAMRREDGEPWSDRQGYSEVPHGFRSSFRDWAATCYPREAIEMSLAIRLRQPIGVATFLKSGADGRGVEVLRDS